MGANLSFENEQHEIVAKLKDLAIELGRSPRLSDLFQIDLSKHKITRVFGNFTIAMKAAGLDMASEENKRKVNKDIFEKPLEPVLDKAHASQLEPKNSNFVLPKADYPLTVVLGDFHAPFQHVGAAQFALDVIKKLQPKRVVQMGDLYDMYAQSKFPKSLNVYTPKEEFALAKKAATDLWANVKASAPLAECFQILGNHDVRPYKRVIESCPELEMLIDLTPHFTFPGVKTIMDSREELELDGVFFHHGYRSKLGDHRDYMNACSVNGHTHKGGTVFRSIWGGHMIWELNCGYLGDPTSKALGYTQQKHTQSTLGIGVIDNFGPRFLPYKPN